MSEQLTRPEVVLQTESHRTFKPRIVGEDSGPAGPFPLKLTGKVQRGFGRGGKDLGCPTANLPDESLKELASAKPGVYFGYAQVLPPLSEGWNEDDRAVWPMVMSLGWNPFYKNEKLSAEVHVMHEYQSDFYGYQLRVIVLGYIRPELDYTSREDLINDIETDKEVGKNSLDRPAYRIYSKDSFFKL